MSLKWYQRLTLATAVAIWLLIVLGSMVRVTESGTGCGNTWPMCHGSLIPSFEYAAQWRTIEPLGHPVVDSHGSTSTSRSSGSDDPAREPARRVSQCPSCTAPLFTTLRNKAQLVRQSA